MIEYILLEPMLRGLKVMRSERFYPDFLIFSKHNFLLLLECQNHLFCDTFW